MAFAKSTTSDRTYEKKNSRGSSFKTIAPKTRVGDGGGGGGAETQKVARKMRSGKPGLGLPKGNGPSPFKEKNSAGGSFKTVAPRAQSEGGEPAAVRRGRRLDRWAAGKRDTP